MEPGLGLIEGGAGGEAKRCFAGRSGAAPMDLKHPE